MEKLAIQEKRKSSKLVLGKSFKSTFVNRTLPPFHGRLLELMLTFPLMDLLKEMSPGFLWILVSWKIS